MNIFSIIFSMGLFSSNFVLVRSQLFNWIKIVNFLYQSPMKWNYKVNCGFLALKFGTSVYHTSNKNIIFITTSVLHFKFYFKLFIIIGNWLKIMIMILSVREFQKKKIFREWKGWIIKIYPIILKKKKKERKKKQKNKKPVSAYK